MSVAAGHVSESAARAGMPVIGSGAGKLIMIERLAVVSLRTLQAAIQEQGRYRPSAMPAPVGGWNARDALDGMMPHFAVQLDNFLPFHGYVGLRSGSELLVGGLGGPVESLMYWTKGTTDEKVLAAANGNIWDVAQGTSTSLGSGFPSNRWEWASVKGSRGVSNHITYLVGYGNAPQAYDGSTLTACTWQPKSGQPALVLSNLSNVHLAKDILFLSEVDQLGFWHSDKGTVTPSAELSWFDLGTVLPGGGEIVAMATMTVEGGIGPDDYSVFISDAGWAALYSGNDPAQATDWSLIGRYPLGQTLGRRCLLEIAGDVIAMTVNGYISLRQFLETGGLTRQSFAFNDNIQPEVVDQTRLNRDRFGWQPLLVPDLTVALFNVPITGDTYVQHVVNTQTAAWTCMKGLNGISWLQTRQNLLFGDSQGRVVRANEGRQDIDGSPVIGVGITAFNAFGSRGVRKQFQLARPILETVGDVTVRVGMPVDYDVSTVQLSTATAPPLNDASQWNTDEWNTAVWQGAPATRTDWQQVTALGYAAALYLDVTSRGTRCRWKSADIAHTPGGLM